MAHTPFVVAPAHVDVLRDNNIFFHPSGTYPPGWFKPGLRYRGLFDVWAEPWSDHRTGPTFSALGAFSYSRSCFGDDAWIGRYCAIGENVSVMRPSHPIDRVAVCGFDYAAPAPYGPYANHKNSSFPLVPLPEETFIGGVQIEPDVWIGNNVLIKRGVRIGTGAILAANAVITSDVEPYTLMAGNPARAKRRRFADALCERLLASAWWDYGFDAFVGMETTDPDRFLDQFGEAVAAGRIAPMPENRINIHAAFARITPGVLEEEAAAAAQARLAAEAQARQKAKAAEAEIRQKAEAAENKRLADAKLALQREQAAEEKRKATALAAEARARQKAESRKRAEAKRAKRERQMEKRAKVIDTALAELKALEATYNRRIDVRAGRWLGRLFRR